MTSKPGKVSKREIVDLVSSDEFDLDLGDSDSEEPVKLPKKSLRLDDARLKSIQNVLWDKHIEKLQR